MTITPSELEAMQEAEALLDTVCTATQTFLTDTQKARALAALQVDLDELRRRWARRFATYVLAEAAEGDHDNTPP